MPRGQLYATVPWTVDPDALPVRPAPPALYWDSVEGRWSPDRMPGVDYVEETPRSRRYAPASRFLAPGAAELHFEDAPTALYRLYGEAGLLYVGVARHMRPRCNQHAMQSPWWPQVRARVVEWYPTHWIARVAEQVTIADEDPLYNVVRRIERCDLKCGRAKALAIALDIFEFAPA